MTGFRFPKTSRLRKRAQFLSLSGRSRQFFGTIVTIQWKKNNEGTPRLGITIPRKFGKAVKRNRFKRLVRESFRVTLRTRKLGIDCNAYPKKNFDILTLSALLADFARFTAFLEGHSSS